MRLTAPLALLAVLSCAPLPAFAGWDEGQAAFGRKDWPTAFREFQPLAQAGHVEAISRLGHLYLHGWGVPKNPAEAQRYLRMAADKGEPLAQNTLGGLMFNGTDMPRDTAQAIKLFEKAAIQGQPNALNNLGQLYFSGNTVPKDEIRAVAYLKQAAEKNIPASWETLGLAYWDGRGVARDHAQAVTWFRKAADQGMMIAQNRLGVALWTGDGVDKNLPEAVRWFEKAGNRGDGSSNFNAAQAYYYGAGVTKDQERAATLFIIAARTAKPAEKSRFETERDRIKGQIPSDIWNKAESKAALWTPGQGTGTEGGSGSNGPSQINAGSGFFVTRDGTVLTNSHVVDNCKSIRVSLEGQPAQAASLIARDQPNDLAILKSTQPTPDALAFREDKPMRSGDAVVVVGFPLSSLLSREPNVTAGVISALAGIQGDKRHYQVTAPVQKGNSGGPLADMSGNVIGIVSSKLNAMKIANSTGDLPQNVNFAIRSEIARKFLSDNGIGYRVAPSPSTLSAADVGEIVKKSTAFVECQR